MLLKVKLFLLLALFISQTGCYLHAKIIDSSVSSNSESSSEGSTISAPLLSVSNSGINLPSSSSYYQNSKIQLTISTRDQFGNLFYDPTTTVKFTTTGNEQDGWFVTDAINNGDGTYTSEYYFENSLSSVTFAGTINNEPLAVSTSKNIAIPRLKFTGNSSLTASVSSRTLNPANPTFVLTGECNTDLGDVQIKGIDETSYISYTTQSNPTIDFNFSVPCSSSNGGEFSTTINFSTSSPPFFSQTFGIGYIEVSQNSLPKIQTYLFIAPASNPVSLINNLNDLTSMVCNDSNKFYVLNADINVEAESGLPSNNYTPKCNSSTPFQGVFDGNNHTISRINTTIFPGFGAAIFDSVAGNTSFSNLKLDTINFSSSATYTGGLIAYSWGTHNIIIHNIVAKNLVVSNTHTSGGIAGSIDNCTIINTKLENSTVTGGLYTGGILAYSFATSGVIAKSSVLNSTINGNGLYTGGLAGKIDRLFFTNSNATVNGNNSVYLGGLSGRTETVKDSFFSGTISSTNTSAYVGNVIGFNTFSNAKNIIDLGFNNTTSTNLSSFFFFSSELLTKDKNSFYSLAGSCTNCTPYYTNENKTLTELKKRTTYPSFDFINNWKLNEGVSTPSFRFNY